MARIVLLCVVMVAFGAIAPTAAPDSQPELTGVYQCDGINSDGTAYEGTVEIDKVRDTFRVRWLLGDGPVMGIGIFSNGVLAVSYFGGAPAVAVYKIDSNKLIGEWAMGGMDGVYSETLTKMTSRPEPREPREPREQPRRRKAPAVFVQAAL